MNEILKVLADQLTDPERGIQHSVVRAGYTYFGQLISHDLVPPSQPELRERTQQTRNFNFALELESIYGALPSRYVEKGKFFVRHSHDWDLSRNGDFEAEIPDSRNDENIITAQLHRIWQRIHNCLVDDGASFEQARNDTILLFQTVVVGDFLAQILQPHIFKAYFFKGETHLNLSTTELSKLFAKAAFRFGHTMVRRSYTLNQVAENITLNQIVARVRPIPARFKIDWKLFFRMDDSSNVQRAMGIDSMLSAFMSEIPDLRGRNQDVVMRNLEAGNDLPSGLEYVATLVARLDPAPLDPALGLFPLSNDDSPMSALGIRMSQMPLWPYLLLEAEIQGRRERLGVLGSLIVAETIRNAINNSAVSVLSNSIFDRRKLIRKLSRRAIKLFGWNAAKGDEILSMGHLINCVMMHEGEQ
ncbi:peroxidase family protein [Ahniella affigens]|uniref:peroxidase family protein n=1 Tax=Ahniella affigens TaxID=2021234 RepID=UPI001476431C|nr:peroxidase family protein [Ahniella affigens]